MIVPQVQQQVRPQQPPPLQPLPPPVPYTGPLAEDTPVAGCAAALICVYDNQCNSTGFIKGQPQPDDDLVQNRVQLTVSILQGAEKHDQNLLFLLSERSKLLMGMGQISSIHKQLKEVEKISRMTFSAV